MPAALRPRRARAALTKGTTVNVAARVTGAAGSNETCTSEAVFHELGGDPRFPMERAGTYRLKGIAEPQDLFRLVQTLA